MADVFVTSKGTAHFYDAHSGETRIVPSEQISQALESGLTPLSADQIKGNILAERYDAPVQAFLAGGARGLTMGLSDVALRGMGVRGETLAGLEEYNPTASTAGEVAGIGGSVFVPGGPLARLGGAAAKLGRAATMATSRATGRMATSLVPRAVGAVAREGVTGLAIGTGQAASDMALKRREASLASLAEGAAEGLLVGAGFGAGLTALGAGARAVAAKGGDIASRLGLNTKRTRDLMSRHRQLRAELDYLGKVPEMAQTAKAQALQAEFEAVSQRLIVDQMAKLSGMIVGGVAAGGIPGAIIGMAAGPRILEAAQKYVRPLWSRRQGFRAAWEGVGPDIIQKAATARPAVYRYGPAALEAASLLMFPTKTAAHMAARHGGHIAVDRMRSYGTKLLPKARHISSGGAVRSMTASEVKGVADELTQMDVGASELVLRMSAPGWVQATHVDEMANEATRGLAYLKQKAPMPPDNQTREAWDPTETEIEEFSDRFRATLHPETVLTDLANKRVSTPALEAVAAVHPAALSEMRNVIRAEYERNEAQEAPIDDEKRRLLSEFLGDPSVAPILEQPMMQARLHMALQQGEQTALQQPARPKMSAAKDMDIAERNQARLQRMLEGRA